MLCKVKEITNREKENENRIWDKRGKEYIICS